MPKSGLPIVAGIKPLSNGCSLCCGWGCGAGCSVSKVGVAGSGVGVGGSGVSVAVGGTGVSVGAATVSGGGVAVLVGVVVASTSELLQAPRDNRVSKRIPRIRLRRKVIVTPMEM